MDADYIYPSYTPQAEGCGNQAAAQLTAMAQRGDARVLRDGAQPSSVLLCAAEGGGRFGWGRGAAALRGV